MSFFFGEICLDRFEDHKCNSPVDCCSRRLDGGEHLFLPTAKMQTNLAGTSKKSRSSERDFFIQADRLGISSRQSRVYHRRRRISSHEVCIRVGLMIYNASH